MSVSVCETTTDHRDAIDFFIPLLCSDAQKRQFIKDKASRLPQNKREIINYMLTNEKLLDGFMSINDEQQLPAFMSHVQIQMDKEKAAPTVSAVEAD